MKPDSDPFQRFRLRLEQALADAEAVANQVSDVELEWWPFEFLRPSRDRAMSDGRVVLLALLYGLPTAGFMVLYDRVTLHEMTREHALAFILAVVLGVFAVFRFTFAYFWNRRAARLVDQGRDRVGEQP